MALNFEKANTDTKVKFLTSNMHGAPEIRNEWGTALNTIDTVLVEGFNESTPTSIKFDNSTKIATITYDEGHSYQALTVIKITGTNNEHFDKEHRVLYSDRTTLKIKVEDNEEETIEGENIKIKYAPLGFSRVHDEREEKGIACYKNSSKSSPAILKLIDHVPPNRYGENWTKWVRVVFGVEIDSEGNFVNNEKAPYHKDFPDAELTGNGVEGREGIHGGLLKWDYAWPQGSSYSTSRGYHQEDLTPDYLGPTEWMIVGDDNTFYLFIKPMKMHQYVISSFGLFDTASTIKGTNIYGTGSVRFEKANSTIDGRSGPSIRVGLLRMDSNLGNFLFCSSAGATKLHDFTFRAFSYFIGDNENGKFYPTQGGIAALNNQASQVLTSPIMMKEKDSDTFRGTLRGARLPLGVGSVGNMLIIENGNSIILTSRKYNGNSSDTYEIPVIFSLKDWSEV